MIWSEPIIKLSGLHSNTINMSSGKLKSESSKLIDAEYKGNFIVVRIHSQN